ncbi:AraC family transcriptional regulator [Pedobacter cryoconitis]|uniref:AraC family transcriptional regulator n=1 Tax=Pedobacter cryoconitis TaxID=188932 RepID=A0A127V770_9SPHI|nr:AraC family transcriptional regulator [Pedobacter cryoconitis]AMP97124.1 AraC family transcriptional regulator [Pedobacter cryoconitis]
MKIIPIRHINETRKEPGLSGNFSIRNLSDLLAGQDMLQELHRHDFFYVLVLNKGIGDHEIDFTTYTICDHSVFFMRPGQVHQLRLKAKSTGYLIQFGNEFFCSNEKVSNQLLRKAGSFNYYQFNPDKFQKLLAILNHIFQEYTVKEGKYQQVIKANMDVFLIELIRQQNKDISEHDNLYSQEIMEKFSELLEKHAVEHKQVTQYAAMLNLSTYQLNSIAKSMLGKTCSALINAYMILEAKRNLLATANQINQIACHLGYEDVSYFIRFFKKHTGYSPEMFRHNLK